MSCTELEQDLALAAAGCLEPDRLRLIQAHTRSCAACADRWRALKAIGEAHRSAAKELQSIPLRLVPKAAARLRGTRRHASAWTIPAWRWVLPLGVAVVIALLLFKDWAPLPPAKMRAPTLTVDAAAPVGLNSLPASLGRYRRASHDGSGDALDALLAQDADRLLKPPPPGERLRLGDSLSPM